MQEPVIRFCGRCIRRTVWKKKKPSVVFNIIMILITGGLWVVPWLTGLMKDDVLYCSECSKDSFWDTVILLFVFAVIMISMFAVYIEK